MHFALLGNHPDGAALAQALLDSGRHALVCVSGGAAPGLWPEVRRVSDAEEVLADPAVEAVIVAGPIGARAEQLRRALRSERPVLCVHPADEKPDAAYEAGMIQADVKQALVPILYESLHPALRRLAAFVEREASSPLGAFRLLLCERQAAGEVLLESAEGVRPSFPGWDILRRIGGELGEVSAFADGEAVEPGRPVLLAGRFEQGGLFQVTLVPGRGADDWRLTAFGERGRAELYFPQGWHGPAFLTGPDGREEHWPRWDPWPSVVEVFELAVARQLAPVSWQDEVRILELDDAARRSVQKRRAHLMDYQEASEEVGFKGTMALAGCGLLWGVLLLAIASMWVPRAGWLILPLLLAFVALQLFRYVIPKKPS